MKPRPERPGPEQESVWAAYVLFERRTLKALSRHCRGLSQVDDITSWRKRFEDYELLVPLTPTALLHQSLSAATRPRDADPR